MMGLAINSFQKQASDDLLYLIMFKYFIAFLWGKYIYLFFILEMKSSEITSKKVTNMGDASLRGSSPHFTFGIVCWFVNVTL